MKEGRMPVGLAVYVLLVLGAGGIAFWLPFQEASRWMLVGGALIGGCGCGLLIWLLYEAIKSIAMTLIERVRRTKPGEHDEPQ
jgi:hypothetical protein